MRVLIPEGNLSCYGIVRVLSELYGDTEVGTAASIDGMLERAAAGFVPDLVLLDAAIPGFNGFSGLKRIVARWPEAPVVMTSSSESRNDVLSALRNGARGVIPISSKLEVLRHALPLMLSGELYIPAFALRQEGAAVLASSVGTAERQPEGPLTPRQFEVLTMLAAGKSNKEIARQLRLIDGTVKLHVRAILRTLGVTNRTQAVIAAVRIGYLPSDLLAARQSTPAHAEAV